MAALQDWSLPFATTCTEQKSGALLVKLVKPHNGAPARGTHNNMADSIDLDIIDQCTRNLDVMEDYLPCLYLEMYSTYEGLAPRYALSSTYNTQPVPDLTDIYFRDYSTLLLNGCRNPEKEGKVGASQPQLVVGLI